MAQVTYPGVYVEEVSSGVRPISAASTSVTAFIGVAERGPVAEAVKVFSFTEYQSRYGGFLADSFLSHSVYQFFNNGGAQCYIVRVTGANPVVANLVVRDRATANSQPSLTISASSPGVWGNGLAVLVEDGALDPTNEFSLSVFQQDETTPLERFDNLSMIPGAPNYVETVITSSRYIRVTVNIANTGAAAGASRGSGAPLALASPRTRLRININGDGYQQVALQGADLASAAGIAAAIQTAVRELKKLRSSTDQKAFNDFTCQVDRGALLLTSGVAGRISAVTIAPALDSSQDASGLLRLGRTNGGVETLGAAVTRPRRNPPGPPPDNLFSVGDHALPSSEVVSVQAGSDGVPITTDQPYINAFSRLDDKEDVSLIAVPGIGSSVLAGAAMNYCANRSLSDCFFIGDMSQHDDTVEEAKAFRDAISPKNVVRGDLSAMDTDAGSNRPIDDAHTGAALGFRGRIVCKNRCATRSLEGAGRHERGARWRDWACRESDRRPAGEPQSVEHQCPSTICELGNRHLGRTHHDIGCRVELRPRAAHGDLPASEHLPRDSVGGVRAERRRPVVVAAAEHRLVHDEPVPPRRLPGRDARSSVLREMRQRNDNPGRYQRRNRQRLGGLCTAQAR